MIRNIIDGMRDGNFSFLILVVGAAQLAVMTWNAMKPRRDDG